MNAATESSKASRTSGQCRRGIGSVGCCGSGEICLRPPGGATERNLPRWHLERIDRGVVIVAVELIGAAHA